MDRPGSAWTPYDQADRVLEANVRPPDWTNPQPAASYHLLVIGAGTAGLVTAAGAAGLGARVALIERDRMGGDCLNAGCVPSKALIAAARAAAAVRRATSFGLHSDGELQVDFERIMGRMRQLRAEISPHDSARRFSELGVDVFLGQASFLNSQLVQVTASDGDTARLPFRKAVIATGGRAATPDIPGIDQVRYLTNESLFRLTELPRRLAIIGSGPIGTEMAQTFARFGSLVYLFEQAGHVLPREDADAAAIVEQQLRQDGVQLKLRAEQLEVHAGPEGQILVRSRHGDAVHESAVDELLVAVGRTPNTDGLNLAAAGVNHDAHGVLVDDYLRTSNPRIYAAGDVCSRYKFTHAADFQARTVIQNALFALGPFGRRRASQLVIPWTTYTSPEIAHVGLYPAEAQAAGRQLDTYVQPLDGVDRAILDGQQEGFVKIHTQRGSDRIVGATIVADHAGDLISEVTLAMSQGLGLGKLAAAIHPYPTQADAIRKLGDQYNRTRLTPLSRRVLAWLQWLNVGR